MLPAFSRTNSIHNLTQTMIDEMEGTQFHRICKAARCLTDKQQDALQSSSGILMKVL